MFRLLFKCFAFIRDEQERLRKIEAEMRAAEEAKQKEQERIRQEEEHRKLLVLFILEGGSQPGWR